MPVLRTSLLCARTSTPRLSWRVTLVASSTKSTMMWIVGCLKWMPSGES